MHEDMRVTGYTVVQMASHHSTDWHSEVVMWQEMLQFVNKGNEEDCEQAQMK